MTAWKLPLIVAALAVPIVAAFLAGAVLVGGPAFGFAAGALAVVALLVVAARQRPREPLGEAPAHEGRRRVLVVAACPVEAPGAVAALAREVRGETGGEGGGEPSVLVLAPAGMRFLDRWASDVEASRRQAQERLVATVAALAKAGIDAEARVGDEDVVQAVEDQLSSYRADEVILVSARGDEDEGEAADAAAEELRARLRPRFRHLQT
jgi:hypothetical protein